ncbi:MAG: hypothetical protein ACEPOV_03295 [Hyphomicrobiales bacterium]
MDRKVEEILYRSFDKDLNDQEALLLEAKIAQDDDVKEEYEDIVRLRELLASSGTDHDFSVEDAVMSKLEHEGMSRSRDIGTLYLQTFRKIAWSGVAAIIIAMAIIWLTVGLDNFFLESQSALDPEALAGTILYSN